MSERIRDRIKAIQVQLRDQAVTPGLAREALVQLTALYGNVIEEARERVTSPTRKCC